MDPLSPTPEKRKPEPIGPMVGIVIIVVVLIIGGIYFLLSEQQKNEQERLNQEQASN